MTVDLFPQMVGDLYDIFSLTSPPGNPKHCQMKSRARYNGPYEALLQGTPPGKMGRGIGGSGGRDWPYPTGQECPLRSETHVSPHSIATLTWRGVGWGVLKAMFSRGSKGPETRNCQTRNPKHPEWIQMWTLAHRFDLCLLAATSPPSFPDSEAGGVAKGLGFAPETLRR